MARASSSPIFANSPVATKGSRSSNLQVTFISGSHGATSVVVSYGNAFASASALVRYPGASHGDPIVGGDALEPH